jgi:hypothetical protein
LARRSTATSCRSTSSSASLDAVERLSRTSQPPNRTSIRQSRRKDTADHHVLPLVSGISPQLTGEADFWHPTACAGRSGPPVEVVEAVEPRWDWISRSAVAADLLIREKPDPHQYRRTRPDACPTPAQQACAVDSTARTGTLNETTGRQSAARGIPPRPGHTHLVSADRMPIMHGHDLPNVELESRAYRRLGARSPWAVSITYCDGSSQARPGSRGTTRGTSAGRIPVRCVLSVRPRMASVQVERPARPGGPLLIRRFRVRAPGAPPGDCISSAEA